MAISAGLRVLVEARRFVTRGWSQGADARDADGFEVDPWEEQATSWSLLGAIVAVLEEEARGRGEVPLEELGASMYALADLVDVDSLADWNDAEGRTQLEIVRTLEAAEARYEAPWPDESKFHPN